MQSVLKKLGDNNVCPIVVVVQNKKILLGLRNYTADKWKTVSVWTVPGGRCDAGETVEETLRREVQEEIGVTDVEFTDYLGEHPGAKDGDRIEVFVGSINQIPRNMEPHKFTEWKWFSIDDWPDNFINPQVESLFKELLR